MRSIRAAAAVVGVTIAALPFRGDAGECHVVEVELQPAINHAAPIGTELPPQIVAWIENSDGAFVETIYMTAKTGIYGIGNRPGRFDFNSAKRWPYGRRITVAPVWAHKKTDTTAGEVLTFDTVMSQTASESALSQPFRNSSLELPTTGFCRPLLSSEAGWDTGSCASVVYTDKGVAVPSMRSLYPPRANVTVDPERDSPTVAMFAVSNPYDAISQATPLGDTVAMFSWIRPQDLPAGDYVLWLEVSKEFDHNATYSVDARPAPVVSYGEYGKPYRGQPSVLYRVPFAIAQTQTVATTLDYAGYGDPDGNDGVMRAPDATITSDVAGSGAGRLAVISADGQMFRVRVTARPEIDDVNPAAITAPLATATSRTITVSFNASGDDDTIGHVKRYDVRYRIGESITEDNFDAAGSFNPRPRFALGDAGSVETFTMEGLLPETNYSIGVRPIDNCHNAGPLTVIEVTTLPRAAGEVDWCFIATAAYGSSVAGDVALLRHYRDALLAKTVLGQLAIETYYTFSPSIAGLIGESELLRETARGLLAPLIEWIRQLVY